MSHLGSRRIRNTGAAVAALVAGLGATGPTHAQVFGNTITVDTTADTQAVDGHCSLREAIIASNNDSLEDTCLGGSVDTIVFQLGSGNPQIDITSALPPLSDSVIINGGTGGATRVVLHGSGLPGMTDGLVVRSIGTVIRNLVINNFPRHAINILSEPVSPTYSVTVVGNYLGTDATGTAAMANGGYGVLSNAASTYVGGTTGATPGGPCTGDCNLIAVNAVGVYLTGNAVINTIRANSIHDNFGGGIVYDGGVGGPLPPFVASANTAISGSACNDCTVDVYADYGDQGKTWLGATTADDSGAWSLGVPAIGPHITATATSTATSAFSVPFLCPDADSDGICNSDDNCVLAANSTQIDADGDLYGNACDADFDSSGIVGFPDLAIFRARFGTTDAEADLDGNGQVGFSDLAIFRGLFGKPPGGGYIR